MPNKQVEKMIWDEIWKRDITFYDMIGSPECGVCTDQKDIQTSRLNRFKAVIGCERMKELLSLDEYNQYNDYPPLKVTFQDLFMFWWDKCIDQHLFLDEVLDDIYDYFTEQMRPPQKEAKQMQITLDFKQLPLFPMALDKAA
jgi:hypothetical protein